VVVFHVLIMRMLFRPCVVAISAIGALLMVPSRTAAQTIDLTLFGGAAYPLYDERLTFRPPSPTLPGVDVTVTNTPVLRGDGGPVFGAALAVEFGIVGIEGRIDAVSAGLEFTGARYDLRGTGFPFQGLTASLIASAGRFDADRISLLSLNAKIRTPGKVSVVASGGLSYLPDITISGSVPLRVEAPELAPLPAFDAALTLRGVPGQSEHRFGINGGAGLRIGGRAALFGEVRAFYFRDYELRFASSNGPELLNDLLAEANVVRFSPVFVNAQVGLSFRF
jgi:hypothetical protein